MVNRKRVIKGLKHCSEDGCKGCPYTHDCNIADGFSELAKDALELLKEQEPVEAKTMGEAESHGSWWFACGACGHAIDPEDNYCRECGRKVKWDEKADR